MDVGAEKDSGPIWAEENDPRVTRGGKFLRRHHIDEIPQFWNVLRGDMNVIGPRPERPEFFPKLRKEMPDYCSRLAIRPGVTGLAQVRSGYANCSVSARRKHDLDLYYISNRSLLLDVKIVWSTLWFFRGGKSHGGDDKVVGVPRT